MIENLIRAERSFSTMLREIKSFDIFIERPLCTNNEKSDDLIVCYKRDREGIFRGRSAAGLRTLNAITMVRIHSPKLNKIA